MNELAPTTGLATPQRGAEATRTTSDDGATPQPSADATPPTSGATLGRGEPSGEDNDAPRWYDRGYMMHVDGQQLIQHVSYHLADSLPRAVAEAMDAELKSLPPKLRDAEKERRITAYLDAGHGSCILRVPELAAMVEETFVHFHNDRYHLHAWCVMPNHVHVLFRAINGWSMSKIVASWKSYTGRKISAYAKEHGMPDGLSAALVQGVDISESHESAGLPAGLPYGLGSGLPGRVWHREYWDRFIRDAGHFMNAANYIHNNPVKAGLVRKAEDWQWSSAARTAPLRTENGI